MQTYRIDLAKIGTPTAIAVEATSVQYVRGNAKGFSNAILLSADVSSQRVRMLPGQKLRFQKPIKNLYIENADGEADIVGELVAGLADFEDSRVIGNLSVSDRDVAAAIEGKCFWRQYSVAITASGAGNVGVFALRNHENNDVTVVLKRLNISLKNDVVGLIKSTFAFQRDTFGNDLWTAWATWPTGFNARAYNIQDYIDLVGESKARMLVTTSTDAFPPAGSDQFFKQSIEIQRYPRIIEPGRGIGWSIYSPTIATTACIEVEWTELTESETEFI